jgi:hypothetical protein
MRAIHERQQPARQPLCEAVLCLTLPVDATVDADAGGAEKVVEAPGIEPMFSATRN